MRTAGGPVIVAILAGYDQGLFYTSTTTAWRGGALKQLWLRRRLARPLHDSWPDALIFLRDPLTAHPHEPDIETLLKLCDTHDIIVATNGATATLVLEALTAGR